MRVRFLPILLGVLAVGPARAAEPPSIPFSVVEALPSLCENAGSFSQRLQRRSPRLRRTEGNESTVALWVSVWETPTGTAGRLTIRDPDGHHSERTIEGDGCINVLDALSLVGAVLLAPNQKKSSRERGVEDTTVEQPPRHPLTWGVAVTTGLHSATGPGLPWIAGARGFVSVGNLGGLSPSVSLGLYRHFPSVTKTSVGEARFDGWTGRLVLSPVEWPARGRFSLRPALGLELGRVSARGGQDVPSARSSHALYAAPEASYLLQFRLTPSWAVLTDLALVFPLTRHHYHFETPEGPEAIYDSPRLGGAARLGVAATLP